MAHKARSYQTSSSIVQNRRIRIRSARGVEDHLGWPHRRLRGSYPRSDGQGVAGVADDRLEKLDLRHAASLALVPLFKLLNKLLDTQPTSTAGCQQRRPAVFRAN